jgi:hypothetical protein
MNATTQIISILSAMGAAPIATTNATGETVIKVNAPVINKEDPQK